MIIAVSCQGRFRDNVRQDLANIDASEPLHYDVVSASYISNTFGGIKRKLKICIPSDYDTITHDLPALYLFHGSGGDEMSWLVHGNLLSNLSRTYRSGQMVPVVVVLPVSNPEGSRYFGVGPEGDLFVKEVIDDIIPFVESNFKVSSLKKNRAVGGYSAGGMQTLNLALFFPEMFEYAYPIGACFFPDALDALSSGKYDHVLRNPEINNIKRFFISMGLQDVRYEQCQKTLQLFDDYHINYDYWEAEGGHDFKFWEQNLEYMLVELFRM